MANNNSDGLEVVAGGIALVIAVITVVVAVVLSPSILILATFTSMTLKEAWAYSLDSSWCWVFSLATWAAVGIFVYRHVIMRSRKLKTLEKKP